MPFSPLFVWEGSPTKIDYSRKGTLILSSSKTRGPKAPEASWALTMGCFQGPLRGPGSSLKGPGPCIERVMSLREVMVVRLSWSVLTQISGQKGQHLLLGFRLGFSWVSEQPVKQWAS